MHAIDSAGTIVAQVDRQPRDGAYPTSLWLAGEYLVEPYSLRIPNGGPVRLIAGWYDARNGVRLPVQSGLTFEPDALPLADRLPVC